MGAFEWVVVVILAIALAIFIANAVYLGAVSEELGTGNSSISLKKGSVDAFLWIDAILAGIIGLTLGYYLYKIISGMKSGTSSTPVKSVSGVKSNNPFDDSYEWT